MGKVSDRNRPWALAGLVATILAVASAMVVGHRLNGEALGVLIGIVGGAGATVLASASRLLVVALGRRGRSAETPAGPVSLSQIPSLTDAETVLAEDEYRRGYRDGWIQAAGTMCDLMDNRQFTQQAAHAACWRHWETTLLPWMWSDGTRNNDKMRRL